MTENLPATQSRSQLPAATAAALAGLPDDLRAQLQADAEAMKAKIGGGGGDKIRLTKAKKFKLPSGEEHAGPLRVVVLDAVAFNAFFDRPYSDKDKTPPACFALDSVKPVDLVPSAASPEKQSDSCKACPNNVFGSKGAGKACGNHYLLAVVGLDKGDSPMYTIQLPPTSGKYWEAAVQAIRNKHGMAPIFQSMDVWFDPASEYQVLRFGNFEANPFLKEHALRRAEATARLLTEPDVSTYKPVPKKAGR